MIVLSTLIYIYIYIYLERERDVVILWNVEDDVWTNWNARPCMALPCNLKWRDMTRHQAPQRLECIDSGAQHCRTSPHLVFQGPAVAMEKLIIKSRYIYIYIYHIILYVYIISYHIISYHIISYRIISYYIISYYIILYYIILYYTILNYIMLYYIMSYYIISYHIILYISYYIYIILYVCISYFFLGLWVFSCRFMHASRPGETQTGW